MMLGLMRADELQNRLRFPTNEEIPEECNQLAKLMEISALLFPTTASKHKKWTWIEEKATGALRRKFDRCSTLPSFLTGSRYAILVSQKWRELFKALRADIAKLLRENLEPDRPSGSAITEEIVSKRFVVEDDAEDDGTYYLDGELKLRRNKLFSAVSDYPSCPKLCYSTNQLAKLLQISAMLFPCGGTNWDWIRHEATGKLRERLIVILSNNATKLARSGAILLVKSSEREDFRNFRAEIANFLRQKEGDHPETQGSSILHPSTEVELTDLAIEWELSAYNNNGKVDWDMVQLLVCSRTRKLIQSVRYREDFEVNPDLFLVSGKHRSAFNAFRNQVAQNPSKFELDDSTKTISLEIISIALNRGLS
jgi:hypothetical protein